MSQIRVLVADDQPLVRAGIRRVIETDESLAVIGEATDGHDAVALTKALRPDVVLMDIRMPILDGIEATARLAESGSEARVVILTTFGLDESCAPRRVHAIALAAEQVLGVTARPRLMWRGLRPCTPDGLPVIGRHARAPRVMQGSIRINF